MVFQLANANQSQDPVTFSNYEETKFYKKPLPSKLSDIPEVYEESHSAASWYNRAARGRNLEAR